ncbi:MAG: ABC transporter ATP-binding protein [Actinomycetota bacterium]
MSAPFGLHGVDLGFAGKPALVGVDVPSAPGEVTVLIGADGAGKTSACRVLVGLIRPDRGEVRRPARNRLGYQPEAAGTWAELTVAENLDFVERAHRSIDPGRRAALIETAGLSAAADRLAGRLSGGMRQKLAVIMAVLSRPELVVLDEPTTGLDPVSRAELWRLLLRAASEGTAVLSTTSYLEEAESADKVVVLDRGEVVASGTARSIRESLPGTISVTDRRPADGHFWRRGRNWRVWTPEEAGEGSAVAPDLEDVVTVASLTRRAER